MWKGLLFIACFGMVACDPCAGVVACEESPSVSYEGQIVSHETGEPVGGVEVEFERVGGVEVEPSSFSVTTDRDGRFRMTADARSQGEVVADLVVHPPAPLPSYRIEGVKMSTTRVRGDGRFFPDRWVVDPYIDYLGELYLHGTGTFPPTSIVEFRRTGGIRVDPDTFQVLSDGTSGRFDIHTKALEIGVLEGELLVRVPGLEGEYQVSGVRVATRYQDGDATLVGRWPIGPHLPYAGLLRYEDTLAPAGGVEVEVVRVGGIPMTPDRYVTQTNEFGTFSLGGAVVQDGEVIVDLLVRPSAPYAPLTIRNLRLPTTGRDVRGLLVGQWQITRP